MDTDQLRTLLEVNRSRHFRRAAETLFITQSTVSARIKKLEQELGVRIFDRETRKIQLTPQGHRLLPYAETIMALWQRAQQDVALANRAQEQLAVGGLFSLWDILLQNWVQQLETVVPDLALLAESHDYDFLLRRLLDGALDLIFIYDPPQLEELLVAEVAAVPLLMVTSEPGLTVAAALAERYIMVDWGQAFTLQHMRLFADIPAPVRRVNQASLALRFILAGGGTAYLAEQTVTEYLQTGRLYRVDAAPTITRHAYAVYHRRSERQELINQVLRLFQ